MGTRRYFIKRAERTLDELSVSEFSLEPGIIGFTPNIEPGCEPSLSKLPDDTIVNTVEHDECGFRELNKTIRYHRTIKQDVKAFHMVWGDIEKISSAMCTLLSHGSTPEKNGVLFAEYRDGSFDRILFHPHEVEASADLTDVRVWSREVATIESNKVTMTLVFLWTSAALLL